MNPADITFRLASATDAPLLRRALLQNANAVHPGTVDAADIDANWRYRRYVDGFPDAHDFGVVAEQEGNPAGIVWARFSSEADPSPGWVNDDIPEVTICVFEGQRGLGIGHDLLMEIEKEALRRGFRALSLWVEEGNRSRRLYQRSGFLPAHGVYDSGTMMKKL